MTRIHAGILTIVMLGTTAAVGRRIRSAVKDSSLAFPLDSISLQIGKWHGSQDPGPDPEILERLKSTSNLSRIYRTQERAIGLFIAFYANQRAGQSAHSPKACLPGHGWVIWEDQTVPLRMANGTVTINKYTVDDHNHRLVVLYWYQSSRRILANELWDKWYLIGDALSGRETGESLVRLIAEDGPDAESAIMRFAEEIIPEVGRSMGAIEPIERRQPHACYYPWLSRYY